MSTARHLHLPALRGGLIALLAAVLFGASTPLVQRFGTGVGSFSTAALYAGAALVGAMATTVLASLFGEPLPSLWQAGALLMVGATGYGLSLRFHLLAQQAFGAARTGSFFAFAPFVGAGLAFLLGERSGSAWMLIGAALMVACILLHLAERHAHEHTHAAQEHEHAHSHDDGHHTHTHSVIPVGLHSHVHRHDPQRHSHPHVPDERHAHTH